MIKVNNFNISDIYYSGYTIIRAYGCGGEQVYNSYPVPYGTRYILYLNDDTTVTGSCTVNGQPYHQIDNNWIHSAETDRFNTDDDLSAVTSVALGECATALNIGAFSGFTNMSAITVSNNLVDIGQGAFSNCYSLQNFPYSESLELIYDSAFYKCYSLTSVTIPSSVVSIGDGAFRECTGLTSVTMEATTPPTLGSYVFYDEFSQTKLPIKIYVPAESLNAYKTATNWSDYADRIYPIGYVPFEEQYLTFDIVSGGTINWVAKDNTLPRTISYSLDGGDSWSSITSSTAVTSFNVNAGDKVLWKGTNTNYATNTDNYSSFSGSTATFNIEGNLMSTLYGDNFTGQTALTDTYAFAYFLRTINVISAENLILPTGLSNYCFWYLFKDCTSLTSAPELPATTLTSNCYYGMFGGCTSLTTAPELPATTLTSNCYYGMFSGCTSLTVAPELPATTLASSCYNQMFYNCTSLTVAPVLSATTLNGSCYSSMFANCTSLTTAPALPATTLASSCYRQMFSGCTSLTTAPELPATELWNWSYTNMFNGCTNLNYIKCLATNTSALQSTQNWVAGVAASGTFVKAASMSSWWTGNNGIPSGWTVLDDGDLPYNQQYLTFVASSDNMSVGLSYANANVYQYSIDSGSTWSSLTNNQSTSAVNSGETILFKASGLTPTANEGVGTLRPSTYAKVQGNVMSLVYGDNFVGQTTISNQNQFKLLFFELGTHLTDASNLIMPATTLANDCYRSMFYGCSGLTAAPELPATTLSDRCYYNMFGNCTSLTTAPDLPATTMVDNCYNAMFMGCTSLNYVKCLANTNSVLYTYQWLLNVSASGTFVKAASMSSWTTSVDGIPQGWTVQNDDGSPYIDNDPIWGGDAD